MQVRDEQRVRRCLRAVLYIRTYMPACIEQIFGGVNFWRMNLKMHLAGNTLVVEQLYGVNLMGHRTHE